MSSFVMFGRDQLPTNVKNLGWLHRNIRFVERMELTVCQCSDCIRHRFVTGKDYHALSLRAFGRMTRGRKGQTEWFEYVTDYASESVFAANELPRFAKYGIPVRDKRATYWACNG